MTGTFSTFGSRSPVATARRFTFSRTEVLQLAIAFVVMTVDMAIIVSRWGIFTGAQLGSSSFFLYYGLLGATAALTGFFAHEMAHKLSAQRSGFPAEFRMYPLGLVISLITAFLGVLFASPGATVVGSRTESRAWGRISLAGPMFNVFAGTAFFAAAFGTWTFFGSLVLWRILILLAFFNSWFATFNLIPFGPLDGRAVLRWNRGYWATYFVVALVFSAVTYFQLVIAGGPVY